MAGLLCVCGSVDVDAGHLLVSCRDRDRKRREEKKNTDPGKSKAGVIDDSLLEKSEDPHEIMEVRLALF